MSSVTDF
ncbi:hypothetical protein YPPY88_4744, partial [Yersinia pestis PY-88]